MSLIEQAARALVKERSGDDAWNGLDIELQEQLRAEVRAVIKALREPTEDMSLAGEQTLQRWGHAADDDEAVATWSAMVDVLLTTGGATG